ncbi:sensor histidine kinase [Dongshaea marina]|uniref:sensor histidine kinase n=1 Tax=Dongshaea marina TaxID=2047966 RepID=UPI000D3E533D|nr:ATP-binding protein [Dongshaea marina]
MEESIYGINRMQEIIGGLKDFARADKNNTEEIDISSLIHSTLNMVRNELRYHCQVHQELHEVPPVIGCRGKISQVFVNMLINASQAIKEQGDIYIRTYSEENRVVIEIQDTGCGIPQEHQEHLFTPFFTTKPLGKGTGLGLSISHGIVKDHGGTIGVESTVGEGTTFIIKLPADHREPDSGTPEPNYSETDVNQDS